MSEVKVSSVKLVDPQNEVFEIHLVSKSRDAFVVRRDAIVREVLKDYNVLRYAYDTREDVFPIDQNEEYTSDPSRLAGFKQVVRVYRIQ